MAAPAVLTKLTKHRRCLVIMRPPDLLPTAMRRIMRWALGEGHSGREQKRENRMVGRGKSEKRRTKGGEAGKGRGAREGKET